MIVNTPVFFLTTFFRDYSFSQIPDIPLTFKILFTLFVLVLIPVYWKHWGWRNFLWFSDIALFLCLPAIWLESGLLASIIGVGVLFPEIYWSLEFLLRLFTKERLFGLTDYMFEDEKPLFLRTLSLFHLIIPVIVVWLLLLKGYDARAIYIQTLLAWVTLFVTFKVTPPEKNINMVFGWKTTPQKSMDPRIYLLLLMVTLFILLFIPTHLLLKWLF